METTMKLTRARFLQAITGAVTALFGAKKARAYRWREKAKAFAPSHRITHIDWATKTITITTEQS